MATAGDRRDIRIHVSTTSITATGRLLRCAALALALLGLGATVARAHDPEVSRTVNNDFNITETSPCTNEAIDIQGRQIIRETEKGSPPGKVHSIFKVDESGTGTGQVTLDRYKFSNSTENEFRSSTCKFNSRFEIRKEIIRVDRSKLRRDDFFLHQLVTLKIDSCRLTTVSQDRLKTTCK
jgi:hypothetical protein